jgi:hypothetical protein
MPARSDDTATLRTACAVGALAATGTGALLLEPALGGDGREGTTDTTVGDGGSPHAPEASKRSICALKPRAISASSVANEA